VVPAWRSFLTTLEWPLEDAIIGAVTPPCEEVWREGCLITVHGDKLYTENTKSCVLTKQQLGHGNKFWSPSALKVRAASCYLIRVQRSPCTHSTSVTLQYSSLLDLYTAILNRIVKIPSTSTCPFDMSRSSHFHS